MYGAAADDPTGQETEYCSADRNGEEHHGFIEAWRGGFRPSDGSLLKAGQSFQAAVDRGELGGSPGRFAVVTFALWPKFTGLAPAAELLRFAYSGFAEGGGLGSRISLARGDGRAGYRRQGDQENENSRCHRGGLLPPLLGSAKEKGSGGVWRPARSSRGDRI